MSVAAASIPPASSAQGIFSLRAQDGRARTGKVRTTHGVFETPAFMPVATQGTVKGLTPAQLKDLGAQILLTNAYHLAVRPGVKLIQELGGVHQFIGWNGPILTDSGGYQIFSLAALRQITDRGVAFRSHVDGAHLFFTPEDIVQTQVDLGVDIIMVLDECAAAGASKAEAANAAQRSLHWARRCAAVPLAPGQLMFGIVQGGVFHDLRSEHAAQLVALDFPGYAVGGLSVGEDRDLTMAVADQTVAALPQDRPRYLMGVGLPEDLIRFVGMGYDMFDCVLPTRNGRNGMFFTARGRLNIRLARFCADDEPVDSSCGCYTCRTFSRAYLRHLSQCNEMLAGVLASLHNLYFYQRLMRDMRAAIRSGMFKTWADSTLASLGRGLDA